MSVTFSTNGIVDNSIIELLKVQGNEILYILVVIPKSGEVTFIYVIPEPELSFKVYDNKNNMLIC